MNEIYECCAGLDVHQRNIVACIMAGSGKQLKKETRTFSTATEDLRSLGGWLKNNGVCTVVMESTGIYWIPVFNILDIEMGLEVILANAGHVKNVPGRKTDAKDCEWLCKLLKNGLVKASFIPPAEIRDLRRLVRYRRDLMHDLSSANNRVIKNLESANIKLASVLTSVLCVTGKKIIAAILEGETNPEVLSEFVHGAVKSSKSDIRKALTGTLRKQDITMLKFLMQNVESIEALIMTVEQEISLHADKYTYEIQLLDEIPGISDLAAKTIISEIGTDMSKFPDAEQFASWVGVAPGSYESAGKKKSARISKGNRHLKEVLVQIAWCAVRSKKSYFCTYYHRLKTRLGPQKAIIAVARKLAVCIYSVLKRRQKYYDLGANFIDKKSVKNKLNYYKRKVQELEITVALAL